jgi:hypothetical protein
VCEGCYALKGAYSWTGVKAALLRRLTIIRRAEKDRAARAEWIDAMSFLLNTRREKYREGSANDSRFFRWHDSGDVQGLDHLEMINAVALATPGVRHWLPTRELPTVRRFLREHGEFAPNLTVRISANKVGASLPHVAGCAASGVHVTKGAPENGAPECPAIHNGNACGDCRDCWFDGDVSYLKH